MIWVAIMVYSRIIIVNLVLTSKTSSFLISNIYDCMSKAMLIKKYLLLIYYFNFYNLQNFVEQSFISLF